MLFKINMYRLRSERAREVRRKLRNLAVVVLLLGISIVVAGLFIVALAMTKSEISAKTVRLDAANARLRESLGEREFAVSDDELSLIRMRAVQLEWSNIMGVLSREALPEMWFTQIRLTEGSLVGGAGRQPGFHMEGRLKSGRKEESLAKVMDFISKVREDPLFVESFTEVKLVNSRWKQTTDDEYLEFEIFCPTEEE